MSAVAVYASALFIVLASLLVGRALLLVLGRRTATYLEGAVGLGVLLVVSSVAIRLPGHGLTSLAIVGVILIASVAILIVRDDSLRGPAFGLGLAAGGLALALASAPFVIAADVGIPGVGINNDLSQHLVFTEYLLDPSGFLAPYGVRIGYPLGPHGVAGTIVELFGTEPIAPFLGMLLAVPVLTAIASLALLGDLPRPLAVLASGLIALAYLSASALGIAGFKEQIAGLFLLGTALALREIERSEEGRAALVVGIASMTAGTVAAYSYPGLAWALGAVGIWGVAHLARARIEEGPEAARGLARRALPIAGPAVAVVFVLGLTQIPRLIDFAQSGAVSFVQNTDSKLRFSVSPLESLGVWPSGNWLLSTSDLSSHWIFGAVGVAAFAFALVWWLRNRDYAIPAAVAAAALVYLVMLAKGGLYVQAKALAVPASLIMALVLAALLSREGGWPKRILAVVFVGLAAYSSFLALRDTVVAPKHRFEELADMRGPVNGETVVSLTSDRFTDGGLRGAEVYSPAPNADRPVITAPSKKQRLPVDFDSPLSSQLDRFDYAITTSSPYQSQAPPNFEPIVETESYTLWERTAPTPELGILGEESRPGRLYHCDNPKEVETVGDAKEAVIWDQRPVIGKRSYWDPDNRLAAGEEARQTLTLPRGTWELSLQYSSPYSDITIQTPTFAKQLPAGVDGVTPFRPDQGPFWPLGTVESEGGKVDVTVRADKLNRLQRLVGVDVPSVIGNVVAVKAGTISRKALACDAYVDHFFGPQGTEEVDTEPQNKRGGDKAKPTG